MQQTREETRQVEPGGDGGEKEGTGLFWDMCVKVKVDPISHVVPIILRILSVLETGSCRKYSRINGAKLIASQLQ